MRGEDYIWDEIREIKYRLTTEAERRRDLIFLGTCIINSRETYLKTSETIQMAEDIYEDVTKVESEREHKEWIKKNLEERERNNP